MTRQAAVVAGLLVACCSLALISAWPSSPSGTLPPAPLSGAAARTADAAPARVAAEATPPTRAEPEAASALQRRDLGDGQGRAGFTLLLVDAVTGAPLPGGEVFVNERPWQARGERGRGRGGWRGTRGDGHWAFALMQHEQPRRADRDGRVVLPPFERRIFVAARAPERLGVGRFEANTASPAILALHEDQQVVVRVSDAQDRPMPGVQVALCADQPRGLRKKKSASTDDDGYAVLEHVQLLREKLAPVDPQQAAAVRGIEQRIAQLRGSGDPRRARREMGALRQQLEATRRAAFASLRSQARTRRSLPAAAREALPDAGFAVLAQLPQLAPAVVRFAAAAPPEEPLQLRLAGTGSLEIVLRGPGGTPMLTPCTVTVRAAADAAVAGSVPPEQAASLREATAQTAEKRIGEPDVRFATLGAGLSLDLAVRFDDDDFNFEQRGVVALAPGETRRLELAVPDWFTVLRGEFRDADTGAPLGGFAANLLISGNGGRIEGERITAAADGTFELPFRLARVAAPYTLEIQGRAADGETPAGAFLPLPELTPGQAHDLGVVPVKTLPLLAHGVVRDDRGVPLRGVAVTLQTQRGGANRQRWHDEAFVRARSDEEGRYRLFGERRVYPMRLNARLRQHALVDPPVVRFGTEQDLVMERLGALAGDGRTPDWMPRGALRIALLQDGREVRTQELRPRGSAFRFRLDGLRAGSYDAAITLRGAPRPLLRVNGLYVTAGETNTDPRLTGLDLASTLFRFVVRATDAQGQALRPRSPLLVQLADENGQQRLQSYPWRGNRVEFFAAEPSVEVVALQYGHRPARQRIAAGESALTLQQLEPILLSLSGLRAVVGAERRVRISLVYQGDTGLPMADLQALDQRNGGQRGYPRSALGKSNGAWLGEGDDVRVALMLDGRYAVVARFYQSGVRGPVSKTLGTIDVTLGGGLARSYQLAPAAGVVRGALQELAAKASAPQPTRRGR